MVLAPELNEEMILMFHEAVAGNEPIHVNAEMIYWAVLVKR